MNLYVLNIYPAEHKAPQVFYATENSPNFDIIYS